MTDSDVQKMIEHAIEHGDKYTPDMVKILHRVIDRHELEKCADYWKWKAGIDDDDAD